MDNQNCLVLNCRACPIQKSSCTECASGFKIMNNTCSSVSTSTNSKDSLYLALGISALSAFLMVFCVICICIFKRRARNRRAEHEETITIDTTHRSNSIFSAASNLSSPISSSIVASLSDQIVKGFPNRVQGAPNIILKESDEASYRDNAELTSMDINIEISCDVCALCRINNNIETVKHCLHVFHEACLFGLKNESEILSCPYGCGILEPENELDCLEISVVNVCEQSIAENTEDNHEEISESDENVHGQNDDNE